MFRNSGFFTTIITTVCLLVGVYYAIKMAANGFHLRVYAMKIMGMLVLINSLLLPKAEMIIKDHVSKKIEKVDNLPLAFALPIGMLEEFGHLLTIGFEQVFAPIETAVNTNNPVFSYYNYGMLFGARLKKELSRVRIKDPEFVRNMQTFTEQCIMMPAMIGRQFTKEELVGVPDMWKLVSSRAGTLIKMDMYQGGKLKRLTCSDAVPYFEEYFTKEEERIINKFKDSEFAQGTHSQMYNDASPLGIIFKKNIKAVYGGNYSATDALRQQMTVNSLSDYISKNSYGMARTKMQQESSWLLSSDTASYYLPMLLVLLKCITYAAFVFMIPLILFNGGIARYGNYLTIVASLQLWASLNAIINMIMGTYSNVSKGSDLIISFASTSTINNHVDTIVTVAAGLQLVVPFLAFAIMQGGVAGISHLAGSIIGGLQGTSSAIGAESATNNVSMDNLSRNNSQRNMHSGFKLDHNMQYADNALVSQLSDGSQQRTNPDGSRIITSGAGMTTSSGATKMDVQSSEHNQVQQGLQTSQSLLKSDQRAYSNAESETISNVASVIAHIAEREHNGETFNYESLGEAGKSMQHNVNKAKALNKDHNYGWEQAGETAARASASVGTPGLVQGVFGASASASVEGSVRATSRNTQNVGESESTSDQTGASENYNNLVKVASNQSWAKENSIDTSYADNVSKSYEKQQRLEQQVSQRREEVDNWHQAKTRIESEGSNYSKDVYHNVEKGLMNRYGVSQKEAHDMIEQGDPRVKPMLNRIAREGVNNIVSEIRAGKELVSELNGAKQLNDFSNKYQDKINRNPQGEIQEVAANKGLDLNIQSNMAASKADLQDSHSHMISSNDSVLKKANAAIAADTKHIQEDVNKYEARRTDPTGVEGIIGKTINAATLGQVSQNIGAPDKNVKSTIIDEGVYQKAKNKN